MNYAIIDGVKCRLKTLPLIDAVTGVLITAPFAKGACIEMIQAYTDGADQLEIAVLHTDGWNHDVAFIAASDGYMVCPSNKMIAAGDFQPTTRFWILPNERLQISCAFVLSTVITARITYWEPIE